MIPQAEAEILRLTAARGTDKSICPSEVARLLDPGGRWQSLMSMVRQAAIGLARAGQIDILRHGKPVTGETLDSGEIRGVIRLRRRDTQPKSLPE